MRFFCLSYVTAGNWDLMSEVERAALLENCGEYEKELRQRGCLADAVSLRKSSQVVTLRRQNGQIAVADRPLLGSNEPWRGVLVLKARDLSHAITLLAKHPVAQAGVVEILASEESHCCSDPGDD